MFLYRAKIVSSLLFLIVLCSQYIEVQPLPSPFTPEIARQTWNSWQEFERENLPWLYRCAGPIGLFCPGPGPDVYDLLPDLPRFPGIIPPPGDTP